jgi:hypothetical protein
MIGGRTPHPYHTRPGMVSQSNDGDPHGKAPASMPSGDDPRATPGSGGTGSGSAPPVRPCRTGTSSRSVTNARRAHGPTAGAALATEPADRQSTRLHRSSASRSKESIRRLERFAHRSTFRVLPGGEPANHIRSSCIGEPTSGRVAPCCARSGWPAPAGPRLSAFSCSTGQGRTHAPRDRA